MGLLRAADGSNTTVSQFAQKAVFICFYEHLGGRFPPPPPPEKTKLLGHSGRDAFYSFNWFVWTMSK